MAHAADDDWAVGDLTGLRFPAHPRALVEAGPNFLTRALRAWGALAADDEVLAIEQAHEFPGGSTGRKLSLAVTYASGSAHLPTALFVKFSRDFADPGRDHGRTQMADEVRFAALTRTAQLPVSVPTVLFADYASTTGTGVLITERIGYGVNGIEPHYGKCLDYELPDALGHYRALLSAVARLAGADRAGRLPADFPVDLTAASVGERPDVTAERAARHLTRYAEFAESHAALLPAAIRTPQFLARLAEEVPLVAAHDADIWRILAARPELIALCHWNANVDNAWFWRDAAGELQCGLLDWGCASRMNVAMAIWGALSSAETTLWDDHFNDLITVFTDEFGRSGGHAVAPADLRDHVVLYTAVMGVTWLLGVPSYLRAQVPADTPSRRAAAVRECEPVRTRLQMLTNVLNVWRTQDVVGALDRCR